MKKLASLAILLFCVTTASAQQKQRIAVLPSVGDLEPTGLILLTDKVREIATQHLPMENFNILKQDVITKMIGEEELYRACKEGVCIGDLAKRTNADYGLRCDIVKFQNRLVLKFEIYSVNEDAIFETFTDYGVKNFDGMLKVLETRLPKTFQKVVTAYNSGKTSLNKTQLSAPAEPAPKADSLPPPPKIYKLTTAADPPDGGRISRSPNYSTYYAGSNVTVIAIPYAGYTFAGWSGGTTSANDNLRITIDSDLTLTANFRRVPEPKPEPPPAAPVAAAPKPEPKPYTAPPTPPKTHKKASPAKITFRVIGAAAAGVGLIGGIVADGAVQSAYGEYKGAYNKYRIGDEDEAEVKKLREDIDSNISLRNTLYILTGVGLSGFAITFLF